MKLIGPETVSQGCIRPVGNGTNSAGLPGGAYSPPAPTPARHNEDYIL